MDESEQVGAAVHPEGAVRPPAGETLWTIQVMRGAAALMVVVGHGQTAAAGMVARSGGTFDRVTVLPWGAGVDLFFVLSGFIMVHASRRLFGREGGRAEFLRRRLVRIVPLYWLATATMLALLAAASLKGGDPFPSAGAVLASLAFFPAANPDGTLFPVLDLGWTLNYEMLFYALFAAVIGWPRGRALAVLGVLLAGLVIAGTVIVGPPAPWFWTRPIILDFGLGVAVGALAARGAALPSAVRIGLVLAGGAMLVTDPTGLFAGAGGVTVDNGWPRVLIAGLPFAAILAAAVLGGEPAMPRVALPLTRIGDASYSLYLFHPFALIVAGKIVQKSALVAAAPGWVLAWGIAGAAVALGIVVHDRLERPLTAAIGRLTQPRRLRRADGHHLSQEPPCRPSASV